MKAILSLGLAGLLAACSSSSSSDTSNDGTTNDPPAQGGNGGASNGGSGSGGAGGGGNDGGGSTKTPEEQTASGCKRGVAYGYHSKADMQALSKGVSWWYNWAFEPDEGVKNDYKSIGVEYVPMVWGAKVDTAQVQAKAPQGVSALLGFNEPNFNAQANLSAKDAAALWPNVQAVADARKLTLVSPAVNFCGGGCQDTDPFKYLGDFFASCSGCRVDAIAVHIYVGCKGENGNHAQWLINHIKNYESKFTQPIWLTEFACDDAKNAQEQQDFLVDAVKYLESDPRVARYAWFAGRADNVPFVDLLGSDGQLTPLGQAYVNAPHDPACTR
ncbi:hypothetical protein AKJ09_09285 [Labilithrix luteola]|uniref:Asl1-like glycosyl hydrolase catalytic domain-containing protein n=1 Tax=Labilithrix luteola TaxID=1391654 RepID=A0A0K1QAB8_9BACT|nr:glycoside hydrolase family protein [Labilithrix luteola]AKV02622.1 hypothetical protein AKJ09_09285 [Labilithrix luteola]